MARFYLPDTRLGAAAALVVYSATILAVVLLATTISQWVSEFAIRPATAAIAAWGEGWLNITAAATLGLVITLLAAAHLIGRRSGAA